MLGNLVCVVSPAPVLGTFRAAAAWPRKPLTFFVLLGVFKWRSDPNHSE
jgi:hypothetical protein